MGGIDGLTNRQREVLQLYTSGLTYREVADELDLSPHTVRRHLEQIYKRLALPRNDKFHLRRAFENDET